MPDLSPASQITLYALLAFIDVQSLLVLWFQIQVFRGKRMPNRDGSADDWYEQKIFYGIAIADILFVCPVGFAIAALVVTGSP